MMQDAVLAVARSNIIYHSVHLHEVFTGYYPGVTCYIRPRQTDDGVRPLKTDDPTGAAQPFPFTDYEVFAHGTFCCDQSPCKNGHSSFLYEAAGVTPAECADKCLHDYNPDVCRYIVVASAGSGTPYCMNAEFWAQI